jgi:hypothetical protein
VRCEGDGDDNDEGQVQRAENAWRRFWREGGATAAAAAAAEASGNGATVDDAARACAMLQLVKERLEQKQRRLGQGSRSRVPTPDLVVVVGGGGAV